MKLCKDCESYTNTKLTRYYGEPDCSNKFVDPAECGDVTMSCHNARSYSWACGMEAKHFKPREHQQDFSSWKKAHAGQYVTGQEWVDAGGNWEEFKVVDHRLAEVCCAFSGWTNASSVEKFSFIGATSFFRVCLDSNGELPQRDCREDIPWDECKDAVAFAFTEHGRGIFYCVEFRDDMWIYGTRSSSFSKPANVDWRESLTLRPEGK